MPLSNPEDKQYEEWGVTPPERNPHGDEEQLRRIMSQYMSHGRWVQRGNIIECQQCPVPHSHAIPIDHLLTGTDEKGLPKFRKLT